MKTSTLLLLSFLLFISCRHTSHDLNIPSSIDPIRSTDDQGIPGTPLYLPLPLGWQLDTPRQLLYFRDSSILIKIRYTAHASFRDDFPYIERTLDTLFKRRPAPLYYKRVFRTSYDTALLYYAPSSHQGKEQVVYLFGNRESYVTALAQFNAGDNKARDSAVATLLSLYVSDIAAGVPVLDRPMEGPVVTSFMPIVYNLDTVHANFRLAERGSLGDIYTAPGSRDTIIITPATPTMEDRLAGMDSHALMVIEDLGQIRADREIMRGMTKGDVDATELVGTKVKPSGTCEVYALTRHEKNQYLVFTAYLYDDTARQINVVRRLARGLTLKPRGWYLGYKEILEN
ncbi:hypothetical protein [Dinghuibacter silviterrae]|uniref:Uncharacterized protein n=1 Tax=Dinghuibacter silviterrae TaxID=1539049 RepID=A0A4R8DII3_9BACT|nr:hypothetical protein [Dinghuibacter silviterrae]TDW96976.1 hypothetical protein EDB95_4812 [Dinghuibacter silviterrae]